MKGIRLLLANKRMPFICPSTIGELLLARHADRELGREWKKGDELAWKIDEKESGIIAMRRNLR